MPTFIGGKRNQKPGWNPGDGLLQCVYCCYGTINYFFIGLNYNWCERGGGDRGRLQL
jgi:hypothetical protein